MQSVFEKLKKFQIESYEKNGGTYDGTLMKIAIKEGEEHLSYIGLLILEPDLDCNLRKIKMR
ncbi:hypothetical protein GCM10007940_28640 [Portibacter lacus]|uniref:Uncharacterized protein n=1 Tax=Portibacter lacus TaxID=1099794 RepID=A0AA37SNV9_9BACT|nr:hypothetical protein GCM10007940_28640 [Portibacter lacus]